MDKLVVISTTDLESLIRKCISGKAGKTSKKEAEEEPEEDEDFGFGDDEAEEEPEEDEEITAGMVKDLIASLVKKKKDEQVKKAFAAIKCKPSVSAVPEAKLKPLYEKLKAIK